LRFLANFGSLPTIEATKIFETNKLTNCRKNMKYIIFDSSGLEMPVIFPDYINHDEMALKIKLPVLSAGKIDLENVEFSNTKGSISLKIPADFADRKDKNILKYNFDFRA